MNDRSPVARAVADGAGGFLADAHPKRRSARRREPIRRRSPGTAAEQLAELRRKYQELWSKHRLLVRQAAARAKERTGMLTLALFTTRVTESAVALVDRDQVLLRTDRWHLLERDRTRWRATARDPAAPAAAPTLVHLAMHAAETLLKRSAPVAATGRYERPDRGDVFDVRFEHLVDRDVIGIAIRDVTRLVAAERQLSVAKATLPSPADDAPITDAAAGTPGECGPAGAGHPDR